MWADCYDRLNMPTIELQTTFAINAKPEIGFAAAGAARGGDAAGRAGAADGRSAAVDGAPGGTMEGEGCSGGGTGAAGCSCASFSFRHLAN